MGKTSTPSLVPRRRKSSKRCSRPGLLKYTVRLAITPPALNAPDVFPTAKSDWHYYSLEKPTPSDTVGRSLEEGSDTADDEEGGSDTNIDIQPLADQALATVATVTEGAPLQPTTAPLTAPTEVDISDRSPLPGLPRNSRQASLTEASTRATTPTQGQGTPGLETPDLPDRRVPSGRTHSLTLGALTNAEGSQWMKSKKTLAYFREVYKLGKLSDVILHWYQLEEALGFQESVSRLYPNRGNILTSHRLQRDFLQRNGQMSSASFSKTATPTKKTIPSKPEPWVP